MTQNLLAHETSPYLLQHRANPVHWRAWNEASLAEAARLDRPILLSIGYAACHWCHVMAHESFEDPETAEVMNALFVNIKVDREERPDIDQIYMAALHALGEPGGWPLTMFLTPGGKPIWGGTYFPPVARYGRPAFSDILRRVAELYQTEAAALAEQADRLTEHLAKAAREDRHAVIGASFLNEAARALVGIMDLQRGGTRGAPKFPNFPLLDFLARRGEENDADCATAVQATLTGLCRGGIFDHIGGGLARYSTDEYWLVPHFEKMLSDNGLLLEQLALALSADRTDDLFRDAIEGTANWLQREMRLGNGLFAASLDADSEGGEGAFYVWRPDEIRQVLGEDDALFFAALYDITPEGNFEDRSIPNRLSSDTHLPASDDARRRRILDTLREARSRRSPPGLDDKQLADWNGYAIAGLATAAFRMDRADWLTIAAEAFAAVRDILSPDGRPVHAHRAGKRIGPAFSADLAALAHAALALHRATQDRAYMDEAIRLLALLDRHHATGDGGFYFTADDGERLIQRRRDRQDDATPNAHGLAAISLVQLWSLTGDDSYRDRADAILQSAAGAMAANAFGSASLLAALDLRLRVTSIVILAETPTAAEDLRRAVTRGWSRKLTLDIGVAGTELPPVHPAHGRTAISGRPTAYVCREGRCSLPILDAEALAAAIAEA